MTHLSVTESFVAREEPASTRSSATLAAYVKEAIETYFADLNGHAPGDLYQMVVNEVEKPLLETVMRQVQGNQTRAAKMLGINRSTLRKKLTQHGLND